MTPSEEDDIKSRVRELERCMEQIHTGRKVVIWVFAAIGGTTLFMLTLFEKIRDWTR